MFERGTGIVCVSVVVVYAGTTVSQVSQLAKSGELNRPNFVQQGNPQTNKGTSTEKYRQIRRKIEKKIYRTILKQY